jgi:hypothetical protein
MIFLETTATFNLCSSKAANASKNINNNNQTDQSIRMINSSTNQRPRLALKYWLCSLLKEARRQMAFEEHKLKVAVVSKKIIYQYIIIYY